MTLGFLFGSKNFCKLLCVSREVFVLFDYLSICPPACTKVIASRLSAFCEREMVFDEGQWGFRPLRSTIGAIGTVRRCHKAQCTGRHTSPGHTWSSWSSQVTCAEIRRATAKSIQHREDSRRDARRPPPPSPCYEHSSKEFRRRADAAGHGRGVEIEWASATTRDEAKIHPSHGLCGKKAKTAYDSWNSHHIDLVCFADDVNMVHRENLAADRRRLITETQNDFGGAIHRGK